MIKINQKQKIIVIVGPTASGKSDLAVTLALKFKGEIISADSRQVYKGLNIGTGKITKPEMKGIPHHLLNVADPHNTYNAAHYKRDATKILRYIVIKRKTPIIAGGTGFYIDTLLGAVSVPDVPPNKSLRKKLSKKTPPELFKIIKKLDPRRAEEIDVQNPVRLIRAIEIAKSLGKVPEVNKQPTTYNTLKIGIKIPADILKKKIHDRLLSRIKKGMIAEARKLHKEGLSWKRMEELGLEYRYLARFLQGKTSKEEMIKKLETEIWHYAKRQMTWFKRDKEINWLELKEIKKIEKAVREFV